MHKNILSGTSLRVMSGVILLTAVGFVGRAVQAQDAKPKSGMPVFKVEPGWAKLPESMKFGSLMGAAVDAKDHVWVLQGRVVKEKDQVAPFVVEFDATGKYVQGWGGPGDGYEWPVDMGFPHGIFVDYQDNVWICARGTADQPESEIFKFTRTGKILLQIGHHGKSKGNADVENLNNAADAYVYPKTNEVFVADGYGNRRVIVYDATTGAYKRSWGAYGNKPEDTPDKDKDPLQQYNMVHQIRIANDGLLYVAILGQGRVQVFTVDGKFVKEVFLDKEHGAGATAIAFSRDPQQQFMYVNDFRNQVVRIYDRRSLEQVGLVGLPGTNPGEFKQPHHMVMDSQGNIYVTELFGRVQKFAYEGLSK